MKAKINQGRRGKSIDRLVKAFEFQYPADYYGYICESYLNGHRQQVIDLFNMMKAEQQKAFLLNYGDEKVVRFIIECL